MSNSTPSIKELKSIVEWVNLTDDVREISFKFGDVELSMSRNNPNGQSPAVQAPAPTPEIAQAPAAAPAVEAPKSHAAAPSPSTQNSAAPVNAVSEESLAAGEVLIKAPMVGTFYAGPRPGAPAFVSPGDLVQTDTVLGIVEVMKLMNNLEAQVEGKVTRILVENGQAVEYGQPLMVIQSDA